MCVGSWGMGTGVSSPRRGKKMHLERGATYADSRTKKQRDVTCFETGWTSYWDTREVRRS